MALINSIAEIQKYIKVSNGLHINSIRPALNDVEMNDLTFYLGESLLTEIIHQKDISEFSARIQKIEPFVSAAAACLALYKAGPEIEVMVNENGILRQETTNEKTAYGGQIKRYRDVAAERGYKAIDGFLRILEKEVNEYPEWQAAEYFHLKDGLLIRSYQQFEKAGEKIKNSSLTFQAFIPILRDVQDQQIRNVLPESFYEELVEQVDSNAITPGNKLILERYIRPSMVKLVMEEALTTLPVEIDHDAVTVNQIALHGDARTKTNAPIHLLEKKAWGLRGRADFYLSNMKEYLNSKASSANYPLWYASDFYEETMAEKIKRESISHEDRRIYRS